MLFYLLAHIFFLYFSYDCCCCNPIDCCSKPSISSVRKVFICKLLRTNGMCFVYVHMNARLHSTVSVKKKKKKSGKLVFAGDRTSTCPPNSLNAASALFGDKNVFQFNVTQSHIKLYGFVIIWSNFKSFNTSIIVSAYTAPCSLHIIHTRKNPF